MLSRTFIILSFFTASLVFAQASQGNTANSSPEKIPHSTAKEDTSIPKGLYLNGVNQNLSNLEKSISEKISKLEKLQAKAAELDKSFKEKIIIADEVPALERASNPLIVTSRHIEFTFQTEKAKEVRVVSRKKNLNNDLHSVVRILTFAPGNLSSIKVTVNRFDSRVKQISEIQEFDSMPLEGKIVALKAIDNVLYNAIFRFDTAIQRAEVSKLEHTKDNLSEL